MKSYCGDYIFKLLNKNEGLNNINSYSDYLKNAVKIKIQLVEIIINNLISTSEFRDSLIPESTQKIINAYEKDDFKSLSESETNITNIISELLMKFQSQILFVLSDHFQDDLFIKNETNRIVFQFFLEIIPLYNNYGSCWKTHVYDPKLSDEKIQALITKATDIASSGKSSKEDKTWADGILSRYTAITYEEKSDQANSIPHIAHPVLKEPVTKIIECIDKYLPNLNNSPNLLEYLTALKNALSCNDVSELNCLWEEAAIKWLNYKDDIQCDLAEGELYDDRFKMKCLPCCNLFMPDTTSESKNIENKVSNLIKNLPIFLRNKYKDEPNKYIKDSLVGMDKVYINVLQIVLSSSNFYFMAQVLPSSEKVIKDHGVKIYFFLEKIKKSMGKDILPIYKIIRGKENDELSEKEKDEILLSMCLLMAGHELMHLFARNHKTTNLLSSAGPIIEEAKATQTFLMNFQELKENKMLEDISSQVFAYYLVSNIIRVITIKEFEPTDPLYPYYIDSVGLVNRLVQSRAIIIYTNGFCEINLINFYNTIESFGEEILEIYKNPNAQRAKAFIENTLNRQPCYEAVLLKNLIKRTQSKS